MYILPFIGFDKDLNNKWSLNATSFLFEQNKAEQALLFASCI
jgi:hypothetical protein